MKTQRSAAYAALLCALAVFLNACGGAPTTNSSVPSAARSGGTIAYRLSTPPSSLNYVMAADEATVLAAFFLLTGRLVDFDHKAQKYVPALAESWQAGPDGQTVSVKLRAGLKFSDGHELTSEDVAFTLAAIYDAKTNSPAWKDAMLVSGKPITVKVIDRSNFELGFPERVAAVENYMGNVGILPAHLLKAGLDAGTFSQSWKFDADVSKVAASGPFKVESATAGERITLVKNPNYWKKDASGTQLPYLDKLSLEVVPDSNNVMARLSQNTLDMVDRIRPADFATLSSTPGSVKAVDVGPGLGTDHMWFNLNPAKASGEKLDGTPKHSWFSDRRFRTAVSHAIDRATIATSTLRGLATPLQTFISPGNRVWARTDLQKTPYSLERAGQILAEAGFEKRGTAESPELFDAKGNRVEFTLVVPAENEPRKLMAAVIQQDLAKLGIKMDVAPIEVQNVNERWMRSFDYDAVLFGLSMTDVEPSSLSNFIRSGAAAHQWQPNQKIPATPWEAEIDRLFAAQATESDQANRLAAVHRIQEILAEELPVIPLVARHVVAAANVRIGNHDPSTILPYSLWNVDQLYVK